jgi:aminoglycoside/choline kinase family phosphotransferase
VRAIPSSAGDLTEDWLSEALDTVVRSVTVEPIGSGQTSSTCRLSIDADCCPRTLVAKFAAGDEESRRRVATAHRNEVGFYRELAPTLDVRTPSCFFATISPDATSFTLLLEDLSPRLPGRQADGCSSSQATQAVRNLARFHASRWNDTSLGDVGFLLPLTEERATLLADITRFATDQFVARYADQLNADEVATLRQVAANLLRWQLGHPEPYSLVHGDYRLDNLMFDPAGGDVVAVDWQTVSVALPARDLAYFVSLSLPIERRRAEEERLITTYFDELRANGVTDYPPSSCAADYRSGQLHGPMITVLGSLTSSGPRTEAGDEMFLSMARRSCAAVQDHQSLGAL